MPDITVGTGDLARAIKAVVPHAENRSDLFPEYCRVRFAVAGPNLHVFATDRVTAAVALVSIEDHGTGEAGHFDLTPSEAREITRLFKPATSKDAIEGDDVLELRWTDADVTITDTGGLFPGKSATWPTATSEAFPDVESLVGRHVHAPADLDAGTGFYTGAPFIKAFTAAGDAYKQALLLIRSSPKAVLVSCGDSFLGVLSVSDQAAYPGDDTDTYDQHAWRGRLPAEPRFTPADVEIRHADDTGATAVEDEGGLPPDLDGDPDPVSGRHLTPVP